jgi:hypothetical protein
LPLVLAYHGCDLKTAQELLGGSSFQPSNKDYDWLGAGIYFWENDIVRAYQWATEHRRIFVHPTVVGAAIELGNCLDLTTQSGIEAVKLAYNVFIGMVSLNGDPIPENVDPAKVSSGDKIIRRLDCAVMNCLFETLKTVRNLDLESQTSTTQPYTTVRALFPEGTELYPGAGFRDKTHIQICVREPEQILGVFRIPEWQSKELELPSLYQYS